jgi:Undecaprenyl-phosphate glucose phosphotransferase
MTEETRNGIAALPGEEQRYRRRARRPLLSKEVIPGLVEICDFLLVAASGLLGYGLWAQAVLGGTYRFSQYFIISIGGAIVFVASFHYRRGYGFDRLMNWPWQAAQALITWGVVVSFFLTLGFVLKISGNYSRGWLFTWVMIAAGLMLGQRAVMRSAIAHWSRDGSLVRRVAILGAGETGEHLLATLGASGRDFEIVGLFDDRKTRLPAAVGGYRVVGTTDDLLAMARASHIDEVIIALPLVAMDHIGELVQKLMVLPVDIGLSADAMAAVFPLRGLAQIGEVPILRLADRPLKNWNRIMKGLEDRILALLFLILLAPLLAAIAMLIKLDSRGPVFFVQARFGFDNRPVRVIKFRSLFTNQGDPTGSRRTVVDDPRVTRVGRPLRAWSLDELPQLWNVLRGEMSIVGPRAHPLGMMVENDFYYHAVREYVRRHRVKPGMTGWAQVNGSRGEVDSMAKAQQRVAFDLYYIDHWSLWLDLKIILLTLHTVVSRKTAF